MAIAHSGVQRVYKSRGEPSARAESHTTNSAEGDRPDGVHHSSQVHGHRAAAEAEHMRGCHDTPLTFSRCQARNSTYLTRLASLFVAALM